MPAEFDMNCAHCDQPLTKKSVFCPFCGEQVRLPCHKCNYLNLANSQFCGNCGTAQLPTLTTSRTNASDNSILDVTDLHYPLPKDKQNVSVQNAHEVPFWSHEYIYEYEEINYASKAQRAFYHHFKKSFLHGIFLDIAGNSNYAFILLFDLQNQYKLHRNLTSLEESFSNLGKICPATVPYGRAILREAMTSAGNSEGLMRLKIQEQDDEYWRFGSKFKKKLSLTFEDVELLNNLPHPRSNFVEIEYCCIQVIKLYLTTIDRLRSEYSVIGTTLELECKRIADIVARKHFRYRPGSYNYQWAVQSVPSNIYSIIFKHCENAVREKYGHKRKLNTNIYDFPEVRTEIDTSIISKLDAVFRSEVDSISPPDEDTEIELNAQNTNRWKVAFQQLTAAGMVSGKQFVTDILELANLNKRNSSVENIFFEGSKFISKTDKEAALTLYVHYLHYDLMSIKFDNKKFTKTIQKNLFKTKEQLHQFEVIVSDFINDRNLEKALLGVSEIYIAKRKEIKLNREAIQEAHSKHSSTVGILNEFLQDEYEDDQHAIVSKVINDQELQIEITQKTSIEDNRKLSNVELNPIQTELLILFAKSNFYCPQDDLENFARVNGLFKNQLVESINEACFDFLDDVLIEEEDDEYVVNPDYLKRIINL